MSYISDGASRSQMTPLSELASFDIENMCKGNQDDGLQGRSAIHWDLADFESGDQEGAEKYHTTGANEGQGRGRNEWTQEEERRIIRKFDKRLVLFMALLYLLSFLDRSSKSCYQCS